MPEAPAYAAIDLGATSGRVVTGRLQGDRMTLEEVHRFPNRPVRLPDGLRWNLLHLFTESLEGCAGPGRCEASASTPGASTTRCSTSAGACSACRSTTATSAPTAWSSARSSACPPRSSTPVTGIQTMPINTVFQLLADEGSAALAARSGSRSCPTCSRCG